MKDFINEETRKKYHMDDLNSFCERHDEIDYYKTFLIQTDHIANKITESQVLGLEFDIEKYRAVLEARAYCRTKINELSEED